MYQEKHFFKKQINKINIVQAFILVKGIGFKTAKKICKKIGLIYTVKFSKITQKQKQNSIDYINKNFTIKLNKSIK